VKTISFVVSLLLFVGSAQALKSSTVCPPSGWTCGTLSMTSAHPNFYQHPEIVLIFWEDSSSGAVWSRNVGAPNPSYGGWIGYALSLVNTPFFAGLAQYGGPSGEITRPRLSSHAPIWSGATPSGATTASFSKADVQTIIDAERASGVVPDVPPEDDMLYVVIPPPNTWASDCARIGCNDWVGVANTNGYERIIIGNPVGGNPGPTLAHEIAEAITVWQGAHVSGCSKNGVPQLVDIADVCCYNKVQNSVNVTAYWSQADHACVIPEAWGSLETNSGPTSAWQFPAGGGDIRQASGGAGGVVATGTDDNVYFYPGGSEWWGQTVYNNRLHIPVYDWEPIGPGGAAVAAGGGVIAVLPIDTANPVQTYAVANGWSSSSFNQWRTLPTLPGGVPATSLTVTSDGTIAVTDASGNGWFFSLGAASWSQVGVSGDQLVASGRDLLALGQWGSSFGLITNCPGAKSFAPGSCTNQAVVSGVVSGIVASADASPVGYVVSGRSGGLYVPWRGWITQSQDFAVSAAFAADYELIHGATFSNPLESYACYQSPNYCAPNAWQLTNANLGRLISGAQMFGTYCGRGTGEWCVVY
jgi:hypothetical protein